MGGDDPQGGHADGQHVRRGVEEAQQHLGDALEGCRSHGHDADGGDDGQLDGLFQPVRLSGAEVVGHDGDHAVVQAEDGHEDEALELEIGPEHGGCGGGEAQQDAVEEEDHHGADALHEDGGDADAVDGPDGGAVEADLFGAQVELRVVPEVQEEGQPGGHPLADDRGQGRAGHLQPGQAEEAEDEDGVQDDVQNGPGELGDHGELGPAGGLEEPLQGDLAEEAQGGAQADASVGGSVADDLGRVGLEPEEGACQQSAQQGEGGKGAQGQEDAHVGHPVGGVLILGPQGAGDQGVEAHAGADGHGDHQGLEGKGQGDGGQGVLADLGHEDAVHDVVQGLDQHGDHHGDGHAEEQLAHGHNAHLVFGSVFHSVFSFGTNLREKITKLSYRYLAHLSRVRAKKEGEAAASPSFAWSAVNQNMGTTEPE